MAIGKKKLDEIKSKEVKKEISESVNAIGEKFVAEPSAPKKQE